MGGAVCSYYYIPFVKEGNRSNNILIGFLAGKAARYVDGLSQTEARDIFMKELSLIFGNPKIKQYLESYRIISWQKVPYIWGGYSYATVQSNLATRHQLTDPIKKQLFFCGEACNFNGHNSTVHGAMETAEYTAQQIESI